MDDRRGEDADWLIGAGIAEHLAAEKLDNEFVVEYDNWDALEVFLDCAWRKTPTPFGSAPFIRDGVDHQSLQSIIYMRGIRKREAVRSVYLRVRLLEQGALAAINDIPLEAVLEHWDRGADL